MPGSQLKRLKASLKQAGVIGQPQQSKKAKKQARQNRNGSDARLSKEAALESIREEFNPFEIKKTREKHAIVGGRKVKGVQGRPGISKQIGEETRRNTLLVEMKNRNKVGGIVDKRFGENDPTMAPEDKMLERFTKERQQRSRKSDVFNLEDDDILTHYGQSLGTLDDFDASNPFNSDEEGYGMGMLKSKKRPIALEDGGHLSDNEDPDQPARKKSKAEVMKEVIMKSKLHKFERQQEKDKDEDLREELDAELGDIRALLAGIPIQKSKPMMPAQVNGNMNPERLANLNSTINVDTLYDTAVREMTYDRRSKPADRTKTAEELIEERAAKLEKLERSRQKRMRGEESSEDEQGDDEVVDEDDEFGIGKGAQAQGTGDDEDLVYGDSEKSDSVGNSDSESATDEDDDNDIEEEGDNIPDVYPANIERVVNDLKGAKSKEVSLTEADFSDDYRSDSGSEELLDEEFDAEDEDADIQSGPSLNKHLTTNENARRLLPTDDGSSGLAYTFPCPQTLQELNQELKTIKVEDLPTVVKRIRVLHHASLHPDNKGKLEKFTSVLTQYVLSIASENNVIPLEVVDTLIRHIHSLSKIYPQSSATTFREALHQFQERISSKNPLGKGDAMLLTAIATIYPTSDHFHIVVTPASLIMGRYLEAFPPVNIESLLKGTFVVTLCAQYQAISKRVIPEAVNFINQALVVMAPVPMTKMPGTFPAEPICTSEQQIRMNPKASKGSITDKLRFTDVFDDSNPSKDITAILPATLVSLLKLITTFANLYAGKSAFLELFQPSNIILNHYASQGKSIPKYIHDFIIKTTLSNLDAHLNHAQHVRKPLELHHHRPLPIPSNMPKFDESYSLDRHTQSYDPDRDRKELSKLKTEHKRERKGALKELRKDAAFIAREKLKERKVADQEYHAKLARITGMIQSEEGQANNEYEREKSSRKKKSKK